MKYILFLAMLTPTPVSSQEVYSINVNRFCADFVNIPYASDNFTDDEWEQFKSCVNYVKYFEVK
jgi:hypothetical protein